MRIRPALKISVAFLIIAIFAFTGVASAVPISGLSTGLGDWRWSSPWVQGNTIYGTSFVSANTGWAVGIGGVVLKTTDAGNSWIAQTPSTWCGVSPGSGCSLFAVDFVDANTGWAVGEYSTIWKTTNGGSTWAPQTLPAPHNTNYVSLRSVDFVDANRGVALGNNSSQGVVFYTTNGGSTWMVATGISAGTTFEAVHMVNSNTGWAVGTTGAIYGTVNGGSSWAAATTVPSVSENLTDVYFTDATHGFAVGRPASGANTGRLLRFDGTTWTANTNSIGTALQGVTVAGSTLAVAGEGGAILRNSTDIWTGDLNTVAAGLASVSSGTLSNLEDIGTAAGSTTVLHAAGAAGAITRSSNGGSSWDLKAGGDYTSFSASSFISPEEGWVGGVDGIVLHTLDGGGSWTADATGLPADFNIASLHFINATTGFAAGCRGADCPSVAGMAAAYRYDSGTWTAMTGIPPGAISLNSVHMSSSTNGWAVGHGGMALKTSNGTSWSQSSSGIAADIILNGVDTTAATNGWAVGEVPGNPGAGVLLRYDNGSNTWSAPTTPALPKFLAGIDMVDANTGYAVGSTYAGSTNVGNVFKTVDGGANWAKQTSGTSKILGSVSFVDANTGYAAGEDGRVIKTLNGGGTWTIEDKVGTNIRLLTVSMTGDATSHNAFIAGGNAAILKYAPRADHLSYYWTWYDYQSLNSRNWVLVANPAGATGDASVDLFINGVQKSLPGYGQVSPGSMMSYSFPGIMGGPVDLGSLTLDKTVATQRVLWGSSLEEIEGTEQSRLSDHFYWTWYDMLSPGFKNWVLVANPNAFPTSYEIKIAGGQRATGTLQPGERVTPTFAGTMAGPVEVRGWNPGDASPADLMASQRVLMNSDSAFNEVPGIPAEELSSDYVWTWYDQQSAGARNWILIANPAGDNGSGGASQIYYKITIGGQVQTGSAYNFGSQCKGPISDNSNNTPQFDGVMTGPVRVETFSDAGCTLPAEAIATQRITWNNGLSFEEVPGFPAANLTDTYHWPVYDQATAGMTDWVLVGNQNAFPVWYEITIGNGTVMASGEIPSNGRVTPTFAGTNSGPLKVQAWTNSGKGTPADVMASQRVLYNGYFNELFGIVMQ